MNQHLKKQPPRRKPVLLYALFLLFFALLIPSAVYADDCFRDPLNAADCVRTQGVRQAVTTAIGIAGTGGVVIQNIVNGRKPGEEKPPKEKEPEKEKEEPLDKDPCADDKMKFDLARANLRSLFASREKIQNFLTMLEEQYENTRQSSYWSGAVNVAFLGASVFGGAIRGAIGMAVSRTLAQNIAVSMATALGQQAATNALRALTNAGIEPVDLIQPMDAAKNEVVKDIISEAVTQQQMNVLGRGLDPNGPVFQAVKRGVQTNWATPMANLFGDTMSLLSTGSGIIKGIEKLEGLRGLMSRARQHLSSIDLNIEDARSEVELAQHSLDLCKNSESYARYLKRLAFSRLPSQG
jgi:hypothetical protein